MLMRVAARRGYRRMLKPRGAVVLIASQPFASDLGSSCRDWLKVEWIWDKVSRSTGFAMARKRPMKIHENVMVFYQADPKAAAENECSGRRSAGPLRGVASWSSSSARARTPRTASAERRASRARKFMSV